MYFCNHKIFNTYFLEPIFRHTVHLFWMLIPMLGCLAMLAVIRVTRGRNFYAVFDGFLDLRAFRRYLREETIYKGVVSNLLLVNTLVVLSLVCVYLIKFFISPELTISYPLIWGFVLGVFFVYYWFKKIIIMLVGALSDEQILVNEYLIFNKFYLKTLGLLLLPIFFFVNFLTYDLSNSFILMLHKSIPWILVFIVVLGYLIKIYQGYMQCLEIKVSRYYLILYFCTLEILPLIGIYFWFQEHI